MKALNILLFTAAALVLGACASGSSSTRKTETAQVDLTNLKNKINEVAEDDFGEFMIEMHRAEQQYDRANAIHGQLARGELDKGVKDPRTYANQGSQAAEQALLHRDNAETAFNRIISVLDETSQISENSDRLAYLESLHVEQGMEIPTLPVYFAFSSSQVNRSEEEKIKRLVESLDEYPIFSIKLLGYADTVGSKRRNYRLAEGRNYAVLHALHKHGLPVNTAVTIAIGEAEGPDETRNPQNRRVEVIPYIHGRRIAKPAETLNDEAETGASVESGLVFENLDDGGEAQRGSSKGGLVVEF